jgi:hypothetical protein
MSPFVVALSFTTCFFGVLFVTAWYEQHFQKKPR